MGKRDEPLLCPTCRLSVHLPKIKPVSYTTLPTVESALKQCMKLRRYAERLGLEGCPHFPKSERINGWFGFPHKRRK